MGNRDSIDRQEDFLGFRRSCSITYRLRLGKHEQAYVLSKSGTLLPHETMSIDISLDPTLVTVVHYDPCASLTLLKILLSLALYLI